MLVFRCECEQVLGVEEESSKGGLGECPTCGRIIRVPQGLINASGRLRLAGTPARASASTSGRDLKVDSGKNGAVNSPSDATAKDTVSKMASIKTPAPTAKAAVQPKTAEPETLAPLEANEGTAELQPQMPGASYTSAAWQKPTEIGPTVPRRPEGFDSEFGLAIPPDTGIDEALIKTPAVTTRKEALVQKPPKSAKSTWSKTADVDDPNAAIETRTDRTLGAKAAAIASQRKKAEAAVPAPAKKIPVLAYALAVVIVLVILAVLYALGVFDSSPPVHKNSVPAAAAPKDTKPAPSPSASPAVKDDAQPKPPNGDNGDKKDDKKDAAPGDTKANDKKAN